MSQYLVIGKWARIMLSTGLYWAFSSFATMASAQDFNLFEAVETNGAADPSRPRASRVTQNQTAVPEFSLVGTSRIGDKFSVMLAHKSGEKLRIDANPNGITAIPSYNGYTIVSIEAGKVSIQYPDDASCQEFPEQGIYCNSAANIASLELVTSKPIQARNPQLAKQPEITEIQEAAAVENPDNPFAIMRNRQAEQALINGSVPAPGTNAAGGRFTPRRIDPTEVPPGMRVVSTPFGDRLVQQ